MSEEIQKTITSGVNRWLAGSITYKPEMWWVEKDAIYAAIEAIRVALEYMPQIKADLPRFQEVVDRDIANMMRTIDRLRELPSKGKPTDQANEQS